MKYLAIALASSLLLPTGVSAQSLPEECPDSGLLGNYVVFTMTVQISMLGYICGEIAPDTRPYFDRVLGRYSDESPACYAATRRIPELVQLPKSPEAIALISDYKSGVMPKERRDKLLDSCTTIEMSDEQARDEREKFKSILRDFPSIPGGG